MIFCIAVAGWFLWSFAGKTKSLVSPRTRIVRIFAPLAVLLTLTIGFIGYYNWRLTGHALLFPHVFNTRTYRTTSLFLWDHPKAPLACHNQPLEALYNDWARDDLHYTRP